MLNGHANVNEDLLSRQNIIKHSDPGLVYIYLCYTYLTIGVKTGQEMDEHLKMDCVSHERIFKDTDSTGTEERISRKNMQCSGGKCFFLIIFLYYTSLHNFSINM